jgi:hypothetical protein
MTDRPDVPRFGELLRDHIGSVPDAARPAFLAGLERSAAERYRRWAADVPEHADALLGCAAREDEIADLVAGLFPVSAELQAEVDAHLPAAVALYYDVFAPHRVVDQLYLQSEAELQGAQAWVSLTAGLPDGTDPEVAATLARCTELEEESSRVVKDLLATLGATSAAS